MHIARSDKEALAMGLISGLVIGGVFGLVVWVVALTFWSMLIG